MNNIITLDQFIKILCKQASINEDEARKYLANYQAHILAALKNDGTVEVPYLGQFVYSDNNIELTLNSDNAALLNEPFEFFEPVELSGDFDLEKVELIETIEPTQTTDVETTQERNDLQPKTEVQEVKYQQDNSDLPPCDPVENETDDVEQSLEAILSIDEHCEDNPVERTNHSENSQDLGILTSSEENRDSTLRSVMYYIFGILTGMILTCIAVYFLYPPIYHEEDLLIYEDEKLPVVIEEETQNNDTTKVILTPSPIVQQSEITDTVTSTYFLASMSRKYYGRMEYWVYIYNENADILGHPDRISTGTIVRIPDLKARGIDVNTDQALDKARAMAAEIYKKWE